MDKMTLKVRLVLVIEQQILLMEQTGENGGKFTLPGGNVERMEFAKKALIRECKEEIGIKVKENDLDVVHILHKKKMNKDRITVYFLADKWKKKVKCRETKKFRTVEWFPIAALPANTSETVRHVLNQIKMGEFYSDIFAERKYGFTKWKRKEKKKKKKAKKLLQQNLEAEQVKVKPILTIISQNS